MALTGIVGAVFERVIIRPVYGSHLKQILVTMGGLIVAEQAIHAIWGASPIPIPLPQSLRGAFVLGDIVMERYRVVAVAIGLVVFAAMQLILNRTRLGLLIRAGVENPEMVEALGYRIRRLFVSVFVAGSALAGLGGVMWAFYRQTLTAGMGMEVMVLVFIVIIIGGLGSVGGCFVGSILVALVANYVGFVEPKLALISNILVMALVLIWRPAGPVSGGAPMSTSPALALPARETRKGGGFLNSLLSSDLPRSRALSLILLAVVLVLAATPFLFSGSQPLSTAAKICVFIVLVASYDLLLGYTGIVSFAHTMFFGIGGYGIAIALERMGPGWGRPPSASWRRSPCRRFWRRPSASCPCGSGRSSSR
jgi:branched-subunit amino acid ABC-type transport system permease component